MIKATLLHKKDLVYIITVRWVDVLHRLYVGIIELFCFSKDLDSDCEISKQFMINKLALAAFFQRRIRE